MAAGIVVAMLLSHWALLGFVVWTLLLLILGIGLTRITAIVTGHARPSSFRADVVHGTERYESVELAQRGATGRQVKKLRSDVMAAINDGDPVVANIIGTITDTAGEVHSYNGGHYVTITGYDDNGWILTVTDPADRVGSNEYQVPLRRMADWISSRGYSA